MSVYHVTLDDCSDCYAKCMYIGQIRAHTEYSLCYRLIVEKWKVLGVQLHFQ